jgi:hypothetical protein
MMQIKTVGEGNSSVAERILRFPHYPRKLPAKQQYALLLYRSVGAPSAFKPPKRRFADFPLAAWVWSHCINKR